MALVVESGSGVDSANSYVSTEDAAAFFTDRGLPVPNDGQLLQAMDALEGMLFDGTKTIADSALSFPRTGVFDRYGVPYSENFIPGELIAGQLWLAHYIRLGKNPGNAVEAAVKRKKVDSLEKEFFEGSTTDRITLSDLPNAHNAINHLLSASSNSASGGRVIRA